jgi:hypothetical protein
MVHVQPGMGCGIQRLHVWMVCWRLERNGWALFLCWYLAMSLRNGVESNVSRFAMLMDSF